MKATAGTYPIYGDANGETWRPADDTTYGQGWLRCVETDRGVRNLASVETEFGPLTIRDAGPADHPHTDPGDGRTECETCGKFVWPVIHSCKGVPVTPAARQRREARKATTRD